MLSFNGQTIVLVLMQENLSETLSSKNQKSQRELEHAVDEPLNSSSLNVICSCVKNIRKIYQHLVSSYYICFLYYKHIYSYYPIYPVQLNQ